jgi:hypothetical protein
MVSQGVSGRTFSILTVTAVIMTVERTVKKWVKVS